jgi:outer membrane scaffolding protein for murein synthesis (MipA/OmpV family)
MCSAGWAQQAPSESSEQPATSSARRDWDAAIGAVLVHAPPFAGADTVNTRLNPGFYLRYGRLSLSTRGAFRPSSSDPNERGGARLDLSPSEKVRVHLGLRYDAGRSESAAPELKGLGDIKSTLRVRLTTSYEIVPRWGAGGSLHFDALGRGGGWAGDVGMSHDMRLSSSTRLGLGFAYGFAGDRYMQSYFGVNAEQALASGYPVYEAKAGARDLSFSATARTDLTPIWSVFYGGGASHLLGPAANSPLTRKRDTWALNAGIVYRF